MSFKVNTNYNGPGVYAIIDIYNFKVYVGSTENIRKRGKQHENALKRNKHNIIELQNDFNNKRNYHFDFIILEKCNCSKRTRLLKEYLYLYQFIKEGFKVYNIYGTKTDIKDIIIDNTIIVLCENGLYYKLVNRYKYYIDYKRRVARYKNISEDQQENTTE